MGQSNLPNKKTTGSSTPSSPKTKSKVNRNLGVYKYIDEDGNVIQVKKFKKKIEKFYPNATTDVEAITSELAVIGVHETIAMGIGDDLMAYAIYV